MSIPTDFTPAEVAAAGDHDLLIETGDGGPAVRPGRTLDSGKVVFIRPDTAPAAIFGTLDHPGKGALEKAHHGVVVLDNVTEFDRPIIDHIATIHHTQQVRLYRGADTTPATNEPAAFRLILATRHRNPRTLPGSLLARVDITTGTTADRPAEAALLQAAREAQSHRLAPYGARTNAGTPGAALLHQLRPGRAALASLSHALDIGSISLRGYLRTLTVAWTLADLAGHTSPTAEDIHHATTLQAR